MNCPYSDMVPATPWVLGFFFLMIRSACEREIMFYYVIAAMPSGFCMY